MDLLNISSAKDFLKCETLAHYRHDLLRAPADEGSGALLVGTIWHKMMEHYIVRRDMSQLLPLASQELTAVADVGKRASAQRIITDLYGALPSWVIPPDWEIHGAEVELRAPLPNLDTYLVGKLDALIKWNGFWWHVQHKTLGGNIPLNKYYDYMTRDWHECGYQYLAQVHGYAPYGGTILIVAQKAFGSKPARILHQYLSRSSQMVDKAIVDLSMIANRWTKAKETNNFIQTRDSCINAFRNSMCPYIGVCNGVTNLDSDRFVAVVPRYANVDVDIAVNLGTAPVRSLTDAQEAEE